MREVTIVSELLVARRRDAERFESRRESAGPPEYERADARGLAQREFERLWALLRREPFDFSRHRLEDLRFASHLQTPFGRVLHRLLVWKAIGKALLGQPVGTSGLHRFPPPFVGALAALDEETLETTAGAWANTEEMAERKDVSASHLLAELHRLAKHATATGRQLFLFGMVVVREPRP